VATFAQAAVDVMMAEIWWSASMELRIGLGSTLSYTSDFGFAEADIVTVF